MFRRAAEHPLEHERVRLLRVALVRHWMLWAGLFVGILAVGRLVFVVLAASGPFWQADFSAYWQAAERLAAGGSVYQPYQLEGPYVAYGFGQYLYPPTLAAILVPVVVLLPDLAAQVGFVFVLVSFAFAATGLVAVAALEGIVKSLGGALLLSGLLWVHPPVLESFITGNVELLQIGALAWAWVGFRSHRPAALGVAVAMMTLVKLQASLLMIWLLLVRDRRAILWSATTLIAVPTLLLSVTGPADWPRFSAALSNMIAGGSTAIPAPTSLLAALLPLWVARLATLLAAVVLVWYTSTRRSPSAGYGAAIVAGFLLSPLVWTRYVALEWVPLILLWYRSKDRVALAVAFLLGWGLSPLAVERVGETLWVAMQAANLAIFLALMLREDRAAPRSAEVVSRALRGKPHASGTDATPGRVS